MSKLWSLVFVALGSCLTLNATPIAGQTIPALNDGLVFATDQGLFERINGQTVRIPTAPSTGLFPSVSRDGRFLTFSRPDLTSNGTIPSSDLVIVDRVSGQQRVLINNDTTSSGFDRDPLSTQVSPNGQFVAQGVRIGPAFTFTQSSPTTTLEILDINTGLVVSSPFENRISQLGPTGDTLAAEFRGISFLPNSDSFVTPVLDLVNVGGSAAADTVSSIVRFDRNNAGQWFPAQSLSTPTAVATEFVAGIPIDVAITYQTYPAISPSGAGLAYFDVLKPNRTGSLNSRASTSRVVVANADGSNPSVLTSFAPGFLPSGLTWTPDGSALLVSVSEQINLGTGFLDLPNTGDSAIFSVPTSVGGNNFVSELPNAFAPTVALVGAPNNLTGDFNGNGRLDTMDLSSVNGLFSVGDLVAGVPVAANSRFDLTQDARVNAADLDRWLALAGASRGLGGPMLRGDADLDGDVAFADFLALSASFGTGREWSQGNFDGSSNGTQFADFLALSGNFGQSANASLSVPEPANATSTLALFCGLLAMGRTKRSRNKPA